jgi:hypothetical protein
MVQLSARRPLEAMYVLPGQLGHTSFAVGMQP